MACLNCTNPEAHHSNLAETGDLCDICAELLGCACMCFDVDDQYKRVDVYKVPDPYTNKGDEIVIPTRKNEFAGHRTVLRKNRR